MSGAVFLSYASQDAAAARRICDALRAADVEVWFDQSELVGGDAWDQKIRKQIRECALLIPVISQTTQGRREAYFRLEWKLADERTHLMAKGTPFLLPVTIDETSDRDALVPDSFLAVQWTKAPGGELPAAFGARLKRLLGGGIVGRGLLTPPRGGETARSGDPALQAMARSPRWVKPVLVTSAVMVVAGLGYTLKRTLGRPASGAVSQNAPTAIGSPPVLSEARQFAQKADALANRNGVTTEQLAAAAELCDRALALDATDGTVWATASIVDTMHVFTGFDHSEARRQKALRKAARAMALAPGSVEARWANAYALGYAGTPAMRVAAITIAAGLVKERPDDRRLQIGYGTLLREARHYDEAAEVLERAGDDLSAGWNYFSAGRMADARRMADRVLAQGPASGGALLKAFVESIGFEDAAAGAAAVELFTPTDLLEADPFRATLVLAFYQRDPERMLRLVAAFPQDFLFVNGSAEPKRYYSGLAHEMAGRPEAARAEWSLALQQVNQRLAAQPNDPDMLATQALLQACLGEREAAVRTLALFDGVASASDNSDREQRILLRLGRNDEALARLETDLRAKKPGWRFEHFEARFDPRWEALRSDPRLPALLRETRWPEAKPFDDPQPVAAPAADEKSVAVLAFDNLSDDRANEYFSDGISEELLTVLQKIPGLRVAARTSAFSFKGRNATAQEIGAKLGVANLVEGSVRRAGGQVRITARLSRAATGEQLWSESYTRELKDVFAVQSELAETIVGQLRGQLGGAAAKAEIQAQVQEAARGGTKNPDAHELYLQGKYFLDRGNYGDAMRAIGLLQRAVERDPSFALAWAALSGAGWFRGSYGNDRRDFDDGYDLARRAAERTIALEPELAAGYVALFDLQSSVDFDWKGARESLRRAEALAPGDAAVVFRAAQLAYGFGQEELAIGLIKQAAALDPINPQIYTSKGYISLAARRFAEAEAAFRQLVDMTPASPWGHAGIALALVGQGKFDRAEAEARQEPVEWSRLYALSLAQWGRKQPSEADETLAQLVKGAADIAAYQIATIHAYRGEPDAAFEWLERAYRQHDPGLSLSMPDFLLESLHADPRWETFQRKLGLANDRL